MKCKTHTDSDVTAICRICSSFLCNDCRIVSGNGFVCSDVCGIKANTIDSMLSLQKANLDAKTLFKGNFIIASVLIVIGFVLVGERMLFGSQPNIVKFVAGVILMVSGLSWVFYVIFLKVKSQA